jgi:hypothetical protein
MQTEPTSRQRGDVDDESGDSDYENQENDHGDQFEPLEILGSA